MLIAGLIFLFFFTPGSTNTVNPALTVSLLALLTFMPGLLSYFFGKRAIRRLSDDRERRIKQLQNSKRYTLLFGALVLAGFVFEVYYLQLPVLVNRVFAFWTFTNSRTLIGIIPLIIAILLTRLAVFELDRQVRNTSWTKKRFLNLNLKLMIFPLSPFIIYLFIGDLVEHSPLSMRIFFIEHAYLYWIIMLAIVAIMYVLSPSFIRRIWATHPLPDGELRSRIELLAEKENIRFRDVLVWDTAGGKIANAGMAGLMPMFRYIFLTNSLLDDFTMDEIETVVAHEFGHIKYRHMMLYLVLSFGYLVFYSVLYVRLLPVIRDLHLGITAIAFFSAAATLLAFYTYFIFIFRFLSRRFERQADLYAVDSTGKPEVFKSALVKLSATNYTPRRTSRWVELVRTHPSISRRLEFVDRGVQGYADAAKYRRPIFRAGRVSVLVLIALVLLFAANKETLLPASDVHYEIGRQYDMEGMVDEAIAELRKAERIDPENGQVHFALAILYNKKGLVDKAIVEIKKAERIDPENDKVHHVLGVLYASKGLKKKAVRELEKTLQINPGNAGARKDLEQILNR